MSLSSSVLSLGMKLHRCSRPLASQAQQRLGHTVRIILKEDLPNGKAYKGEVLTVKAGYARNHLIPGKFALYATEENFERLDMKDPDLETPEERAERMAREAISEEGAAELKAADTLKHYLRNKVVKMYRKVNPDTQLCEPGMVISRHLKAKFAKQLKIDLEKHEQLHLLDEILDLEEATPEKVLEMVEEMDVSEPCTVEIKRLGDYVARISLAGGYVVPLRFQVLRSE